MCCRYNINVVCFTLAIALNLSTHVSSVEALFRLLPPRWIRRVASPAKHFSSRMSSHPLEEKRGPTPRHPFHDTRAGVIPDTKDPRPLSRTPAAVHGRRTWTPKSPARDTVPTLRNCSPPQLLRPPPAPVSRTGDRSALRAWRSLRPPHPAPTPGASQRTVLVMVLRRPPDESNPRTRHARMES